MKLFHRQYGNGKPVVILHGLFGMSDNWVTIGKKLAEHNYSVFIPDQRNHGNSPHSSKFNFNLLCKDLKEFLEQNQIEKPLIIGHSMGGKVAMLFALNYPENVEKLIVVDMGVKKYPVPNEILIDALFAKSLGNFKSRKEIEDYLTEKIHDLGI
ncbi:MAG: alpha/beta fold hydrolase, partial [Bacteroidetes bacterium]|nr:alpha/beta fold hydrolase [Bacteroidota bacterium]